MRTKNSTSIFEHYGGALLSDEGPAMVANVQEGKHQSCDLTSNKTIQSFDEVMYAMSGSHKKSSDYVSTSNRHLQVICSEIGRTSY
ncbi:hypothetical protein Glove_117g188 [Diversispora epigaea]|uniref:NF-kappa-B-activating protein C-terminal domain-containing protein n=1 Tax=Diversispora epigaea TaxID=1348612 RepID=A0A397J2S4_9GLOM|nr:hypothetical protein Glove_117g188 [Diversispora epigaea]